LRTITTTEVEYSTTYNTGYSGALANLGGATPCTATAATACLIDPVLTVGTKSGYKFSEVPNTGAGTAVASRILCKFAEAFSFPGTV